MVWLNLNHVSKRDPGIDVASNVKHKFVPCLGNETFKIQFLLNT